MDDAPDAADESPAAGADPDPAHPAWHLAQVNIGRLRAPVDDPLIADFMAALDSINALADGTPGFVWRLQTAAGNATALHPVENDELVAINMSVWESVESLAGYVYRSEHVAFMRRRREWFERYATAYLALWWVPAGHQPSVDEAFDRLAALDRDGPTPYAFTFRRPFAPPEPDPMETRTAPCWACSEPARRVLGLTGSR